MFLSVCVALLHSFHLLRICFPLVGFEGNLSLLDVFIFPGGLSKRKIGEMRQYLIGRRATYCHPSRKS